jgi:hypothetical protein
VAVVAGGRHVDSPEGRFAVNAAPVDGDRLAVKQLMLAGEIQILVAPSTCLRKMEGVDPRRFVDRGTDVMFAVAVPARGDIFPLGNLQTTVPPVGFSFVTVAVAAYHVRQELFVR